MGSPLKPMKNFIPYISYFLQASLAVERQPIPEPRTEGEWPVHPRRAQEDSHKGIIQVLQYSSTGAAGGGGGRRFIYIYIFTVVL